MRIGYLQALRAVMETGSVTQAAQRMSRTQPQVSRLIAMLEDELGFALFLRQGRRLVPTQDGIQFYEEAKPILSGFDDVSRIAKDIRTRKDAWLKIIAQPYLAHGILPAAIADFARTNPNARVSLEIRSRAEVGQWIAGQQFDLGIAALPIEAQAVRSEAFARVRVVAALPKGHRLAERAAISAQDLTDEPFVALKPFTLLRHYVDDQFSRAGLKPVIRAETSSGLSACQLVARGLGVTLADPLIAHGVEGLLMKRWEPDLRLTYGFLFPTNYAPSSLALAFAETLKTSVKKALKEEVDLL